MCVNVRQPHPSFIVLRLGWMMLRRAKAESRRRQMATAVPSMHSCPLSEFVFEAWQIPKKKYNGAKATHLNSFPIRVLHASTKRHDIHFKGYVAVLAKQKTHFN